MTSQPAQTAALMGLLLVLAQGCGAPGGAGTTGGTGSGFEGDTAVGPRPDAGGATGTDGTAAPAPAPPLRGLLHSATQLQAVRGRLLQAPWDQALAQLIHDADAALSHAPQPIHDFRVPYYYEDKSGHEAAKKALSEDGYAAYACALAYQLTDKAEKRAAYAKKALEILDAWATVNQRVSGGDGQLVMMYKGIQLVYAADLLAGEPSWSGLPQFEVWVGTQFSSSADEEKGHANNHGAWGTLGAMAAAAFLDDPAALDAEIERVRQRIRDQIAANGELPEENLRTNSGIWYTYFALAPMTGAAQLARNVRGVDLFAYVAPNGRSLRLALDRLFFYSQHPDKWPYLLPSGPAGALQKLLYPCADQLELPRPDDWPGNLFEAMGAELKEGTWSQWVAPYRPIRGGHVWIYPTLTRPGS